MAHNTVGLEISEMRKRVRAAIEQSRRAAAARRVEVDEATAAYETFLARTAEPLVQMLANALRCCGPRELQISDSGVRRACSDDPRVRAFAAA